MGVCQNTNVELRVLVCFRDKLEKLPLKSRGNWANFQFKPNFLLSFPKIWLTHPNKNDIFENIKDRATISQSLIILP